MIALSTALDVLSSCSDSPKSSSEAPTGQDTTFKEGVKIMKQVLKGEVIVLKMETYPLDAFEGLVVSYLVQLVCL